MVESECKQVDRQNGQADRQAGSLIRQTGSLRNSQANKQTGRHIDRDTGGFFSLTGQTGRIHCAMVKPYSSRHIKCWFNVAMNPHSSVHSLFLFRPPPDTDIGVSPRLLLSLAFSLSLIPPLFLCISLYFSVLLSLFNSGTLFPVSQCFSLAQTQTHTNT